MHAKLASSALLLSTMPEMTQEMKALHASVEKACTRRNKARAKKKYDVADEIRAMLQEMGVIIQDTGPTTSIWTWSKQAELQGSSDDEARAGVEEEQEDSEEEADDDEEEEEEDDDDDEEEDDDDDEDAPPATNPRKRAPEPEAAKAEEPVKKKRKEMRGGVVATILKPGKGAAAAPKRRVTMKYAGTLASNGKQFDAGKITFKLGAGEVIKGWDVGCAGMQVGERRQLFIPSKMAYGARGAPPDIPKHADLNFDCVLLKA